jgi:hypothetical protein
MQSVPIGFAATCFDDLRNQMARKATALFGVDTMKACQQCNGWQAFIWAVLQDAVRFRKLPLAAMFRE